MNRFGERVAFAFRCFFSILFHAEIPNDIAQKLDGPAGPAPQTPAATAPAVSRLKDVRQPAPEAFDRAVQMLALLPGLGGGDQAGWLSAPRLRAKSGRAYPLCARFDSQAIRKLVAGPAVVFI